MAAPPSSFPAPLYTEFKTAAADSSGVPSDSRARLLGHLNGLLAQTDVERGVARPCPSPAIKST